MKIKSVDKFQRKFLKNENEELKNIENSKNSIKEIALKKRQFSQQQREIENISKGFLIDSPLKKNSEFFNILDNRNIYSQNFKSEITPKNNKKGLINENSFHNKKSKNIVKIPIIVKQKFDTQKMKLKGNLVNIRKIKKNTIEKMKIKTNRREKDIIKEKDLQKRLTMNHNKNLIIKKVIKSKRDIMSDIILGSIKNRTHVGNLTESKKRL